MNVFSGQQWALFSLMSFLNFKTMPHNEDILMDGKRRLLSSDGEWRLNFFATEKTTFNYTNFYC